MLEHLLIHREPNIGGKADGLQKQIYEINIIPGEDLASFINRGAILQKSILLSKKAVSTNIFFEKVITQLMSYQGFPTFIGT